MQGYFSGLTQNAQPHNPLSVSQSMVFFDKSRHESEILDLKKEVISHNCCNRFVQMRRKETEFEKSRAILQQKVELLELQLKESQEREENIKRMHETLMSALQSDSSSSSSMKVDNIYQNLQTPRELELTQSLHKREILELRMDYDNQIKELKSQLSLKDTKSKDLQLQMESQAIEHQRKVQDLDLDKRDLENKIKKIELEKQQFQFLLEQQNQSQSQMNEMKSLLEDRTQEMERLKIQHEHQINDIKNTYNKQQQENKDTIDRLQSKLNKMENEIKVKFQEQIQQSQEKYIKEVEELQNQMHEQQKRSRDEILIVMKERDDQSERVQKLEKQLDKLRSAPKPITVHLSEENFNSGRSNQQKHQRLEEENDYLTTQIKKMSNQIKELREDVNSYQVVERNLKKDLAERLNEIDNQKIEFQRKINEERRKNVQIEDELETCKQELEKKKSELAQIQVEKENIIQDFKNQTSQSFLIHQSPIQAANISSITASREFQLMGGFQRMRSVSPHLNSYNTKQQQQQQQDTKQINSPPQAYSLKRQNTGLQQNNNLSSFVMQNSNQPIHQQQTSHNNNLTTTQTTNYPQPLTNEQQQHKISTTELKLFQSCQKMVDAASKMECALCRQTFATTNFYDHIVSSQSCGFTSPNLMLMTMSQCQNMDQQQFNSQRQRMNQDEYSICLEEESLLGGGVGTGTSGGVIYESTSNYQHTIQKMAKSSRARAALAQEINRSKEFIQYNPQQQASQKDRFAMTHGSADFRVLKESNSNQNLNKSKRQNKSRVNVQTQRNYDEYQNDNYLYNQNNESQYKESRQIPRPQPSKRGFNTDISQINNSKKNSNNLLINSPSSISNNQNAQEDTIDFTSISYMNNVQNYKNYSPAILKEEDELNEEDSITKEHRIRRLADFGDTDDVGNEGNKSTYLRPSRNTNANKSQIIIKSNHKKNQNSCASSQKENKLKKKNTMPAVGGIKKTMQSRNKNKENPTMVRTMKLNTCKASGINIQYPMTFRHQEQINENYYNQQQTESAVNEDEDNDCINKPAKDNLDKYRNVQESFKPISKAPYTSKKSGNRYNTLLRCSSSGAAGAHNQSQSSYVSPRNLMFAGGARNSQSNMTSDLSGFDSNQQQIASPKLKSNKEKKANRSQVRLNTSSSGGGCHLNSEMISPANYLNLNEQQQIMEFEKNSNDLVTKRKNLEKLMILSDEEFDMYGNFVIGNNNMNIVDHNQGNSSQRHNGTHELMPSLMKQQEDKYATIQSSQNNLVVYDDQIQTMYGNNLLNTQDERTLQQYYTNGSSSCSNVIIETNRNGTIKTNQQYQTIQSQRSNKTHQSENRLYNSTQNIMMRSQSKEKQIYVIRESCPSPLGEDEMIDDLGCPFDNPLSNTQAIINSQFASGQISAKQPHQHQDQVVHVLPKPKFIQTLPMIRMRSITEMTLNRPFNK